MKKVFLLFCLMLLTGISLEAQTVNVTFQVDMRIRIATGYFNPASDVVTCPGAFNNWLNEPPANTEKVMTDADNDSIYTITIAMAPSTTYGYKFNIGLGWDGKDETHGDRSVVVGASDMTVDPSFFNEYTPYTGVLSTVTFNVDMNLPARGAFHPSTDHVYVAGNFTGWGGGALEMLDADNDSIYTVDVNTFTSGDLAIYKFIFSTGAAGSGTWETPAGDDVFGNDNNRIYGVVDGNNVVTKFWENTDPNVTTGDGNITFVVDMSVAQELGVFNPDVDSVQIRGVFNGWGDSDPARSLLNQTGDPNIWFLQIPLVQYILNDTLPYKFFIKNGPGSTPYANTGWEVVIGPSITSDRNRPIIFEGDPSQVAPTAYFENIHTDWVIPTGITVEATFSVDMTPAVSQGFVAGTDTVYWIPRQSFYYAVNNIPWPGEYPRTYIMTDDNTDMIYEGTLVIDGPNFNGFLYNYAYTIPTGLQLEDGTQQECRVRFVGQSGGPRTFDSPWTMPQDIWTNGEKPEEEGPVSSVKEIPGIPNIYSLEQNYPNPFNPATMIRFSIPEQGLVTLKVYNLLGEEIATLLNSELKNGTYEVDFNAGNYSSGIYFYTITANNYIATKKMILMK